MGEIKEMAEHEIFQKCSNSGLASGENFHILKIVLNEHHSDSLIE